MFLTLDMQSDVPIYQQIRMQLITAIACGELGPGQELPSIRQLSTDIGVNMHTVRRAYTLLKEDGYIAIHRKSGAVVLDKLSSSAVFTEHLRAGLREQAAQARAKNMGRGAFLELCAQAYDEFSSQEATAGPPAKGADNG